MLLKIGSHSEEVKKVQRLLGVAADGIFGAGTAQGVKSWQQAHGLDADGMVGPNTWRKMQGSMPEKEPNKSYRSKEGLEIEEYFLSPEDYKAGPTAKEYLFLHHTAGWENPFTVIEDWGSDSIGTIATEFVMGGSSVKGSRDTYDGKVVQAFPSGAYAWHLGKNGSQFMHTHSVGIEVCNFGYVVDGKTWAGSEVVEEQIVTLDEAFREHRTWHRYSDQQIENLRLLILHIADRDNIDVRKGLVEEVKKKGAAAFEFNQDAFYGKVKGMWTHTNTRTDKFDMFPQQELLDMLVGL